MKASIAIFCLVVTASAQAVTLFQVDDFSAGAANWVEGDPSPNPPVQVIGGGPDGSNHLQNVSDGVSAGGRLVMWNTSQWTGNYIGAGVTGIALFADNRGDLVGGTDDINLRLAFNGGGGWFATNPILLSLAPSGANWQQLNFGLGSSDLIHVSGGTGVFADTMGNVTLFEVLSDAGAPNSVGAIFRGDVILTDLRVDSISAVPEPRSLALFGFSLALFLTRRCYRRGLVFSTDPTLGTGGIRFL